MSYRKVNKEELEEIIKQGKQAMLVDMCKCGHERLDHAGRFNEGRCTKCNCKKFTWAYFAIKEEDGGEK